MLDEWLPIGPRSELENVSAQLARRDERFGGGRGDSPFIART
jgi:hypothetical protein